MVFFHVRPPIKPFQAMSSNQKKARTPAAVAASHLDALSRLRLDDFDFGMAGADLFREPFARVVPAVAKQDGSGRNPANEIQQVIAVGVRGQIKILHVAPARDLAGARTEHKRLTEPGGLPAPA